jgi:hypothetical protein
MFKTPKTGKKRDQARQTPGITAEQQEINITN